jgi:hypothetical protein
MDLTSSGLFLPGGYFSAHTAKLPLHAYLFVLHDRSIQNARAIQRFLFIPQTYHELQSLGRVGI